MALITPERHASFKGVQFSETQQRIVDGAIECFRRSGVTHTTMSDIAQQARLDRKTVYRLFKDRRSLIFSILVARCAEVTRTAAATLPENIPFLERVLEGPLLAMRMLHEDFLFVDMVEEEGSHGVAIILHDLPELVAAHRAVWRPFFARARREGIIRSSLSDERLITGFQNISSMLMLRSHWCDDEKRQFLLDFFVPALLGTGMVTDVVQIGPRRKSLKTA